MSNPAKTKPWLPYVAPMAAYMALLLIKTNNNLVWVYPLQIGLVIALLWFFRNRYEELR